MLKLDEELGMITDLNEMQKNNKQITSIMNQTIINNGDGTVLNTGDLAKIKAKISVRKKDKKSLSRQLHENGVGDSDVANLLEIIDIEYSGKDGKFSSQVNAWMSKMLSKALDGSWQIGVGAAGGMLAEMIQHYYGLR